MIASVLIALSLLGHLTLEPQCRCEEVKLVGGWCVPDSVGYVAGLRVSSFTLLEALDPEGHSVDVASLECAGCREAAAHNGICAICNRGIKDGKIYASKLTYYLALGEPAGAADINGVASAERAAQHRGESGWCSRCGIGWIGRYRYHDRAVYDAAAHEIGLLRLALDTLPRCETCAVAQYFGTYCPLCNLTYHDGVASKDGWSALPPAKIGK